MMISLPSMFIVSDGLTAKDKQPPTIRIGVTEDQEETKCAILGSEDVEGRQLQ